MRSVVATINESDRLVGGWDEYLKDDRFIDRWVVFASSPTTIVQFGSHDGVLGCQLGTRCVEIDPTRYA